MERDGERGRETETERERQKERGRERGGGGGRGDDGITGVLWSPDKIDLCKSMGV